jgi:hypothetical protein
MSALAEAPALREPGETVPDFFNSEFALRDSSHRTGRIMNRTTGLSSAYGTVNSPNMSRHPATTTAPAGPISHHERVT